MVVNTSPVTNAYPMARRTAGHENAMHQADFVLFVISSRGSFKQNSMWQA
jgi:hypothetical protein